MIWWRHCAGLERIFYCRIPQGSPRVVVSLHLRSLPEWWCTSESFSLVLYHDWNSELYCKYDKCLFGQFGSLSSTVNLFYTWMEAIRVLKSHNMQRWPHRIVSLKITWCFKYVNLLVIVYLLYSIKVTVFHQSLASLLHSLVINFIQLPYVGHSTSSVAESIKRSPTQSQTQDQVQDME